MIGRYLLLFYQTRNILICVGFVVLTLLLALGAGLGNRKKTVGTALTLSGFNIDYYVNYREFPYPVFPRILTSSDSGFVFFSSNDTVFGISPQDYSDLASTFVVSDNLHCPCGVHVFGGDLWISQKGIISRIRNIQNKIHLLPMVPEIVNNQLYREHMSFEPTMIFDAMNNLYVSIVDDHSIYLLNPNYTTAKVFATGVGSALGMALDPFTGGLWFTDHFTEKFGDNAPREEINYAPKPGLNFGYPNCFGCCIAAPTHSEPCPDGTSTPAYSLPMDSTPIGIKFYNGTLFPKEFWGDIFIAEYGSYLEGDTWPPNGYVVTRIKMGGFGTALREPISHETFIDFTESLSHDLILRPGDQSRRPVDVIFLNDGSMLVSDDTYPAIYRVYL